MEQYTLKVGLSELQDFLANNQVDLQSLDTQGFQDWLNEQLQRKARDKVFQKRCAIRDLRKKNWSLLRVLEWHCQRANHEYENSPNRELIEKNQRDQHGTERAIEGLSKALENAEGPKKAGMQKKLKQFESKLKELRKAEKKLLRKTPEKGRQEEARKAIRNFSQTLGITRLKRELDQMLKKQSQSTGTAGKRFEEISTDLCNNEILPMFIDSSLSSEEQASERDRLRILSNVTLGLARSEFDNILIRKADKPEEPIEVLAMIEAKRNMNDLIKGFNMRQENLGFLCRNEEKYDKAAYRTKRFTAGVFDREAVHEEHGESYVFAPSSFRHFQVEPKSGHYLERLFFIADTRRLQGLSSAEYSRVTFKMSKDVHFDPNDLEYVESFQKQVYEMVSSFQTRDVLELYAANSQWANRIFMVDLHRNKSKK